MKLWKWNNFETAHLNRLAGKKELHHCSDIRGYCLNGIFKGKNWDFLWETFLTDKCQNNLDDYLFHAVRWNFQEPWERDLGMEYCSVWLLLLPCISDLTAAACLKLFQPHLEKKIQTNKSTNRRGMQSKNDDAKIKGKFNWKLCRTRGNSNFAKLKDLITYYIIKFGAFKIVEICIIYRDTTLYVLSCTSVAFLWIL